MRYRWRTRTDQGEWRDTREEAEADAIEAKVAHRDDYPGAPLCWEVWAEIEKEPGG
jgi:hypothetical protein